MDNLLIFLAAFFTSFFGSATPSMLNMTSLKISLEKGVKSANIYNFGVSIIILFQAILGILIASQINKYPDFLVTIEKIAAFIFLGLAFYFYREYKHQKPINNQEKKSSKNSFLKGIIFSTLNMFGIPFYFGVAASLHNFDWFNFETTAIVLFAFGAAIGTYAILFFYGKYATFIENKVTIITKNINLILSLITGFIGVYTIFKHFF